MTSIATGRAVDLTLDLAAPATRVWQAISTAEGLSRWFAPEAQIEPRPGGKVSLEWSAGHRLQDTISQWEPPRRLSFGDTEVSLQPRGIHTSLRLRRPTDQSGYPSVLSGWTLFLANLRHYVEKRASEPCRWLEIGMARPRDADETWQKLRGPGGLELGGGHLFLPSLGLIGRRDALYVPWLVGAALLHDDLLLRISLNYVADPTRAHLVLLGYREEAGRLDALAAEIAPWLEAALAQDSVADLR